MVEVDAMYFNSSSTNVPAVFEAPITPEMTPSSITISTQSGVAYDSAVLSKSVIEGQPRNGKLFDVLSQYMGAQFTHDPDCFRCPMREVPANQFIHVNFKYMTPLHFSEGMWCRKQNN